MGSRLPICAYQARSSENGIQMSTGPTRTYLATSAAGRKSKTADGYDTYQYGPK